jgi:hypothetical protein
MLLTVNYDKSTKVITLSSDESEVLIEVNTPEVLDNDSELNFEVAVDLSMYQESFNEDIEDGHDN